MTPQNGSSTSSAKDPPYTPAATEDPEKQPNGNNNNNSNSNNTNNGGKGSLAPGNAQEQWSILQSFDLTTGTDLKSALDEGLPASVDLNAKLDAYGRNELPKPDLPSYFSLWINAFKDIMMILLCVSMIVLYVVGDITAATAILVIVLMATNIGAYTEYSSNKAAAELGDLPGFSLVRSKHAKDAKSGWLHMSNTKLLPGMILHLKTGDIVPADAIILTMESPDCYCTEAMLTGESEPVHKYPFHHDVDDNDPHAAKQREEMTRLYMGTEFSGECKALVVETGERTQMGQIFEAMANKEDEPSPLQVMIDRLIYVLAILSILVSVINAAVCIPTGRGVEPHSEDPQALICVLNSVALTVAAVPENLPVALVIALAAIIRNLANRGVIVKSLPAGEELSRLNYVFSDKTGTLTMNQMTARAVVTPQQGYVGLGQQSAQFVGPQGTNVLDSPEQQNTPLVEQICMLAAKAQDDIRSNPTGDACKAVYPEDTTTKLERALLETASSKTKLARAAVTLGDQNYLVKVGSDWVLKGVVSQATVQTDLREPDNLFTDKFDRSECMETIDTWAREGYRVICVTVRPVKELPQAIVEGEAGDFEDEFIFLGALVIQDPPREDVAENIQVIRGAGVVVSMITGDNPVTGMSIARQIGLADDFTEEDTEMCLINAFDQYQNITEEEAKKDILRRLHYSMTHKKGLIIGRVSPLQKLWFVQVAKKMGLIVAMTGDGANDAPALRGANVGIAMGNGSDIAKAAGDMVLVNPSFSGIVAAIRHGRLGFDNILKFLLFLLGTNVSEVVIYLSLTFADVVIVLDALNLLVLNLLTDGFPAIALSLEKAEGDLMKRAPLRHDTSVLNKFTYFSITITNAALICSYVTVILLGNFYYTGNLSGKDLGLVEDYDSGLKKVRMMFILLINIAELLLGFSHRQPDESVFAVGFFSGKWMNLAAFSSIALIILMTHLPGLKDIMRTEYCDWFSYLLVASMSIFPFAIHELAKVTIIQKFNFTVYDLYKYEYKGKGEYLSQETEESK